LLSLLFYPLLGTLFQGPLSPRPPLYLTVFPFLGSSSLEEFLSSLSGLEGAPLAMSLSWNFPSRRPFHTISYCFSLNVAVHAPLSFLIYMCTAPFTSPLALLWYSFLPSTVSYPLLLSRLTPGAPSSACPVFFFYRAFFFCVPPPLIALSFQGSEPGLAFPNPPIYLGDGASFPGMIHPCLSVTNAKLLFVCFFFTAWDLLPPSTKDRFARWFAWFCSLRWPPGASALLRRLWTW